MDHNLSRVEDQLREGKSYGGPWLSRIEKLLRDYVAEAGKLAFQGPYDSVSDLPETGVAGYIYLVKTGSSSNYYDEYFWDVETNKYVAMGTSEIELENYAKVTDLNAAVESLAEDIASSTTTQVDESDSENLIFGVPINP